MAMAGVGETKGTVALLEAVPELVVRGLRTSIPAPTVSSSKPASMTRVRSRPVPNPRRFNLTSASEYSNQVERNEERHTQFHTASGVRGSQRVSNSNEKISNYLNIWRIAVSSDRPLPCPLKPSEMHEGVGKDAAWQTKVDTCERKQERNSREQERDCTATVPIHAHEKSKRLCSPRSREIFTRDELEVGLLGRCVPQSIVCGSMVSPKWRNDGASL